MEPKAENRSWGIFSAVGPSTPVKRIGINFGAPGDRKDLSGQEWFGYPRPLTRNRLEFVFDLKPELAEGGGWYSRNLESLDLESVETPWLYASGGRGIKRFEIPLLGKDDPPSTYDVRLYFANLEEREVPAFDVQLQSKLVQSGVVQRGYSVGPDCVQTLDFANVDVKDNLVVEFDFADQSRPPVISAIEVTRNDP
jgi:hypothetical protein